MKSEQEIRERINQLEQQWKEHYLESDRASLLDVSDSIKHLRWVLDEE